MLAIHPWPCSSVIWVAKRFFPMGIMSNIYIVWQLYTYIYTDYTEYRMISQGILWDPLFIKLSMYNSWRWWDWVEINAPKNQIGETHRNACLNRVHCRIVHVYKTCTLIQCKSISLYMGLRNWGNCLQIQLITVSLHLLTHPNLTKRGKMEEFRNV